MIIHNVEHKFFYIDPNIKMTAGSVGGDGSSAANAAMDFPSTFEDNVIYLVRRSASGYFAKLPIRTTASNITSLVILGMPKENEEFWDQMPADAKSAWKDADVADSYATICHYCNDNYDEWTNTAWSLPNCRNLTFRNLKITHWRPGYADNDKGWTFSCNSGYGCNGDIQRCKFGSMEILEEGSELGNVSKFIDLDSPSYKLDAENNPVYHNTNWRDGGRYIYLGSTWGNICTLRNLEFNSYSGFAVINCGKKRNIVIENIVAKARTVYNRENLIGWESDENFSPTVRINNCTYKLYYSHFDNFMHSFIGGRVDRVYIDGVTASSASNQFDTLNGNRIGIASILGFDTRTTGSIIKNVNISFPEIHGGSGHLIAFTYIHNYENINMAQQEQYITVKDITISMCQTAAATYGNENHNDSSGNNFNSGDHGLLCLACSDNRDRLVSSDFLVKDVHLTGYRSNVLYADNAILDLQEEDIVGNVSLFNCVGKIKSITSYYPGHILNDRGSNLLYIGKIQCNLANTEYSYNKQPSVDISWRSHILVHEVNGNCWTSSYGSVDYPHSYICTNDGMAGNYTCRTGRSKCQTWSAYNDQTNTGCSLRLINESGSDDWHWPMRIGADPFKGITKHVQAGSYNANFYLALYGYNIRFDEIKDRFFIRIKLPNGQYVYSQAGQCYLDEDTTWSNIEGTTNYKFVIPLDIDQDGDIEIDYVWSFYMDGAETLLDPYPKLVARS